MRFKKTIAVCIVVAIMLCAMPFLPDAARDAIVAAIGVGLLVFGLPVGILLTIDWYKASASNSKFDILARFVVALFILIFGCVTILGGITFLVCAFLGHGEGAIGLFAIIFGWYLVQISWSRRHVVRTAEIGQQLSSTKPRVAIQSRVASDQLPQTPR